MAVDSQPGPWSDLWDGSQGARKLYEATSFRLSETRETPLLRLSILKNCLNIPSKNRIYESRTSFMLQMPSSYQVVAVAGGTRGNELLKWPEILNMNSNSTILRHQRLTRWDRTSFYEIEMSTRRFGL